MRLLGLVSALAALAAAASAAGDDAAARAQRIVCQVNRDRESRYLAPVFLHRTLSDVAEDVGQRYEAGALGSSYFDQVFTARIAPLGSSVRASYKVLGSFETEREYVQALEASIYDALFDRTLDAIGVYERNGVYTAVLASALAQRPDVIETCPTGTAQFTPSDDGSSGAVVDGVDLPRFLCGLNGRRAHAQAGAFVVHRALAAEARAQVDQMATLGRFTVDGPRKVDESIYAQNVHVKQLYWMAGDSYRSAAALVDLLTAAYEDKVLNPTYSVIGVAQKNGYWSVILATLYRSVYARNPCPLTLGGVDYTS
ncbi:hypothetical protein H4R18_000796 [Coemansia javaensis]|uniref:Uncharacterized protein n=1 Tax=Coemansia javaensis TaxID=2761396 RepID=A0A9W8LMA3_9FUNG|nr:hypothetical protein H4R18_000796 [Coemansia javaensis]